MNITRLAVGRRLSTSAIVVALVVLGLYGLWRLPVDFLPNIAYPLVRVHVWWRGATPEEIDKSLADPIERQMATVDGLDYMESSSIEGMYTLMVNFKYGVDIDTAYQDALSAMSRAARSLPPDIEPPVVFKADPSQLPIVQMTVSSDRWDLVKLRTWVDEWLQDQLLAVPGVAGAEIVGGLKREIRVHLDPVALEKHKITLPFVLKRLREENVDQFGGRITSGGREIIARTTGEFRSLDEIRQIVLLRKAGSTLVLGEIAQIVDSHEEARVITRLDGDPCVKLSVLKQADSNTVEVANQVSKRIREIDPALPDGIRLGLVENQAVYVESALNGVRNSAVEAAVLLIFIVFFFLGSWRQVLVMVLALPVTLVLNFGLMNLAGFSLNIFSLGGLVVAIGVLLDNSTVVIENITRMRAERPGDSSSEIAVDAVSDLGAAMVAATLSFLALFVPFLLVPGLSTLLFRELILVIAGIVLISLGVALTFTPMITAVILGKPKAVPSKPGLLDRAFARVALAYDRTLGFALKMRWAVVVLFGLSFMGVALVAGRLGSEFLPQVDDGRVVVKVKLPTGSALDQTDKALSNLEKAIGSHAEIESSFMLSGGRVMGLYTYEVANEGEIDIQLVPRSGRRVTTGMFIERIRPLAAKVLIPGGNVMVSQAKMRGIRQAGTSDIEAKIKGPEIATLFEVARTTAGALNELDNVTNVVVSMDMTKPEQRLVIDRVRAAELGVSVQDAADTLRSLVTGAVATRYREGDEYYNIRVMIPESGFSSRKDIENLPLVGSSGFLRMRDVAVVESDVGPVEIVREDQVKQVVVRCDRLGVSVGQALEEARAAVAKRDIPAGYEIVWGGQAQMMKEMAVNLLSVFAFAVFFSFIVLAVQFNSFKLPSLVLGSLPFCLTGMVFIMAATGLPIGATVIIGVLIVAAATVNDGVLLLTFARELEASSGMTPIEAVLSAARIRLRPRLMTTTSTLVAFIPLALALEEGGDMLQPMAMAAIGGLIMEIPVALYLMPCLYVIFTRAKTAPAPTPQDTQNENPRREPGQI